MNLIEALDPGSRYGYGSRSARSECIYSFFDKKPQFKEAEIVSTGFDKWEYNPFKYRKTLYLDHDDCYVVKLNDKLYFIGIEYHHWYERCNFKLRRFYPEGRPAKKRRTLAPVSKIAIDATTKTVRNDCQIRTLAAITGAPYDEILKVMQLRGWTEKDPGNVAFTSSKIGGKNRYAEVLSLYNLEFEMVWAKFHSAKRRTISNKLNNKSGFTVKTALKHLDPTANYIVTVRGHVMAIVQGVIFDSWNASTRHVEKIWKVK